MANKKLGPVKMTARGFCVVPFKDAYGSECSLQQSSNGERECIWLGINNAAPKVLARDASRLGVSTTENSGWVPYPVPEEVLMSTRMHLDRAQVKSIIVSLQKWVKTGGFK